MKEAPKPTRKEIDRLYRQLEKEVARVYGKDGEKRCYATVEIHDRRDGQRPYSRPVPHVPFSAGITSESVAKALDHAMGNVHSAVDMLNDVRRAVESIYQKQTDEKLIRDAAVSILGKNVTIGEAYSRYDDAPAWSSWHLYKAHDPKSEREATSYFQSTYFGPDAIKSLKVWLSTGKKVMSKKHPKIDMWYVRTGEMGLTLAALVQIPEEERPKHVAKNRARRLILEKHAADIQAEADKIETQLRAGKTL